MRHAASVFNATEEQRVAIVQLYGCCVEYTVDWIRPIDPAENWIGGMTREEG
jgi:hypothetical protein